MNRLRRLARDESGMSYVFIGLGLMAFLSASMLAIDVGMMMTARAQAQNSADAGALAGALALYYDSYTDRSASGPAVTYAITAATSNQVMGGNVSVIPEDVQFPTGPTGLDNRVQVTVYRRADRDNPMPTFIARYFGMPTVGVAAVATAEVSPASAMTCVKPFTIPDKWEERQDPMWDPATSTYEAYYRNGGPLPNPDIYHPATDKQLYTGYNAVRDKGTRLMIRAGTGNNITPSFYFSLALESVTGASTYEQNICGCNTKTMRPGDLMLMEPGNMVGPTNAGIDCLMDRDPNMTWDTGANCPKRSGSSQCITSSPRIFPIPLYDPIYYDTGKREGRNTDLKVANWIGFFLEGRQGNNVYGRIMPITGLVDGNGPGPEAIFPVAIRLVQ